MRRDEPRTLIPHAAALRLRAASWLLVLGVVAVLGACTKPPAMLASVFDESAKPGAATSHEAPPRRPRREPYKKPAPPAVVEAVERPAPPDWATIYAALPRDGDGNVDWMHAIADKAIAPRSSLAEDAKEDEPTDMDTELVPKDQPDFKVVFPHKAHTTWLACANCHPAIFQMEAGKDAMTMEKINNGEYCGACHGKVAMPDLTGCPRCHTAMPK